MNVLKMSIFISMLIAFCYIGNANAYTFSITNGTDVAIKVDPWGWGVIGGSMMQGKIKHIFGWKIWNVVKSGGTTYYKNAGADPDLSHNKPLIQPGATAVLEFTDIDFGVCFDWGGFQVGLENKANPGMSYSMTARSVGFVTGEAMQQVLENAQEITSGISELGKAGEALGPKGKAAGAALQASGKIAAGAIKTATSNGCGNRSAVIVKEYNDAGKFTGVVKVLVQKG